MNELFNCRYVREFPLFEKIKHPVRTRAIGPNVGWRPVRLRELSKTGSHLKIRQQLFHFSHRNFSSAGRIVRIALFSNSHINPPPLKSRDRKSTRLNSSHGYISYAV